MKPTLFRFSISYLMLLTLLFGLFVASAHGQNSEQNKSIEETINSMLARTWKIKRTNPSLGFKLLEKVDSINNTLDKKIKEEIVWYYYGLLYRYTNKFDLSESYFKKYEKFQLERGNKKQVAAVNLARSYNFSNAGKFEESSKAITTALKLYEEINDTVYVIVSMNKLGYLLSEIGNYNEAHRYLNEAISTAIQAGIKYEEQNAYNTKAVIFDKQNELDSALLYYTKAYKLAKLVGDDNDRYTTIRNMSGIHRELGQLDSATHYGQQALDLAKTMKVPYISMDAKTLTIALRTAQGNSKKAIEIIESITADELNAMGLGEKSDNYYHGAKAYKANGNYRKALESFEKYVMYDDSLKGIESRNKINELEIAYQTEKKEQQIQVLDLKNKNSELLISRKNRTILIGAIALGLITVLALVLYTIIRKYLKQKKALAKALGEKDLLLKEIHHRVKNNLQLVSSLLTLQGQTITDDIALQAINEGKNRVRSMALIHQDLYQTEDITGVSAQTYLHKLCTELFDTYNIKKDKIALSTQIQDLQIDVDTLIPIGLIINELITNSLKYAFKPNEKGLVEIELTEADGELKLIVADNGKGFNTDEVNEQSFGNKLVNSLIQQLDGTIAIKNELGTRIEMTFKDYKISKSSEN